MPMQSYLHQTYMHVTGKETLDVGITPVHICCSHYMKIISKDVHAIDLPSTWLHSILNSKYYSLRCQDMIDKMISICTGNETAKLQANKEDTADMKYELQTFAQYKLSMFCRDFKVIYDQEVQNILLSSKDGRHPYYASKFSDHILKKYIPYLPQKEM